MPIYTIPPSLLGSVVLVYLAFVGLEIGTDKGVSAMKIIVTGKMLDYEDEFGEDFHSPWSVYRLNKLLPDDIRVFSCMGTDAKLF